MGLSAGTEGGGGNVTAPPESAGRAFLHDLADSFRRVADMLTEPAVLESGAAFFDAIQHAAGRELFAGSQHKELGQGD